MHKIYWFSGTGNTRYAAREFAKSFPDAELISIASLDRSEDVVFDADVTGIFFPVYCFGIPNILSRFLERVQPMKEQGNRFVYAVCTSGGYPGAALPLVEDTLQAKNINLNACFHIRMISSYIPLSEPPDEKRMQQTFDKAARAIRSSGRADAESIPIIALTANAFWEDAERVKREGMNEHLPKPLDVGKMLSVLAKYRK